MSTYAGPFSGKDKGALTRADVEEQIKRAGSSEHVDLTGEDLSGADLSGMKLAGTIFRRANLSTANLSTADLTRADLTRADLTGANLNEADLTRAYLNEANLTGANLTRASLRGAYLRRAYLTGANLTGADLTGAYLTEADLNGTYLTRADLIKFLKPQSSGLTTMPGLYLRITEETLTLQHLADTLDSLIMLYVKLWLLDQQRFDDFARYSTERDRSLEAEVSLPIAEMTYNSPWQGKINLDLSPKGVVEALQTLVEMIAHFQIRKDAAKANLHSDQLNNQLKQEELKKARLATIEHAFGTLEQGRALLDKLSPGLSEEQKLFALQSLTKEVLHLASDATLEITLIPPLPTEKQKAVETTPAISTKVTETVSGTSAIHAEEKII